MMCHFDAKRMPYYHNIIIYVEQTKIVRIFLSESELKTSKINKHFFLLPYNDGMDEYNSPFRQM